MSGNLHWSEDQLAAYRKRVKTAETPSGHPRARARVTPEDLPPHSPTTTEEPPLVGWTGKQTETEKRYNRDCLGGRGRFEAVTFHLPGGGRYTPDFMTVDDGVPTFHEVKGAYRLASQGRAWTAFQEAAAAFPTFRFVWAAERGKGRSRAFERRAFDLAAIGVSD